MKVYVSAYLTCQVSTKYPCIHASPGVAACVRISELRHLERGGRRVAEHVVAQRGKLVRAQKVGNHVHLPADCGLATLRREATSDEVAATLVNTSEVATLAA